MPLLLNCASISYVCSWFTLVQDRRDPPPLLVKSTENVPEEMGRQRKSKREAFLPLLLFSTKYLRVIYILVSQTPPPVSQLAAYSAVLVETAHVQLQHVWAGTPCEREAGSQSPQRGGFPDAESG